MHADHSVLEIIAHAMIAFLFLFRGITAIPRFDDHLGRFQKLGVPFPRLVLTGGFVTMLVGGVMVLIDYHTAYAAAALIVFTAMANFLYHYFWAMDDPRQRQTHTWIFCNNVAVMGGLLMVAVS